MASQTTSTPVFGGPPESEIHNTLSVDALLPGDTIWKMPNAISAHHVTIMPSARSARENTCIEIKLF